MSQHVLVKELPEVLQTALASVRYGSKDIKVKAAEKVALGDSGAGNGRRSFAILVNLESGTYTTSTGSWGGQNMFNPKNAVDNDHNEYALPGNAAAITGSIGSGPTWATIHIPASMTAKILPTPSEKLPDEELNILACYVGFTSAFRKELFANKSTSGATIDSLVERGLIKRNKAGATQITTDGKNAVGDFRVGYDWQYSRY